MIGRLGQALLDVLDPLRKAVQSPDAFESDNVFTDPAPDNPSATLAIAIGSPGGPRAIAPRTPQLHSLDTGGDITTADRDFVAFTLAATSDILVQADVSVGPGLLNLRLFNSTGTQLQFAQNANSSITTQLLATSLAHGNYFIGYPCHNHASTPGNVWSFTFLSQCFDSLENTN